MNAPSTKYKRFWIIYWAAALVFLLIHKAAVTGQGDDKTVRTALLFVTLIIALLITAFIANVKMRPLKKRDEAGREIRTSLRPKHFILIALNCIYSFWIMEYVNNEDFLKMEFRYMALNVAGIFIMTMIFLFWLNSWRRSLIAILSFFTTMTIIFYAIYMIRGEPFQFIDFFSFGTAMKVANNYEFVMPRQIIVVLVLSICIMGIYLHLPDAQIARKKLGKILIRGGVFGFMVAMYFFYLNVNWNGGLGILTDLFAPMKTYKKYGTTVGFFCVTKYMRLTAPEGYSVEGTKKIAADSGAAQRAGTGTDVKPVNIIAIMNESWADYRMIGDFETDIPVMPFYDSMKENTIKGSTLVCIRGGGTAKSEYEFLTGNSVKRFPGMVPYVSYFTHDQYSLVTTLEAQGYRSIAMHPYKATNWNRPAAYDLLNFDEFIAEEDFPEDVDRIRGFVSDRGNYEEIIRQVEEKSDPNEPLFLFDITMQNHGGYISKTYRNRLSVEGYTDEAVNNFLSLERDSDDALKYLIEHFEQVEEPTLILMFGDHYPDLPEEFTEFLSGQKYDDLKNDQIEEKEKYFNTPFFIWANYDIEEAEGIQTSTNYLGTMMMEQTGLLMAPYNDYLSKQRETIPALNHLGYQAADGTWHTWAKGEKEELDAEWRYECLQYNDLAEKRRRMDAFFTVSP